MQRIPEPEIMNDRQQALAYASADFSEPHNIFVYGIDDAFPAFKPERILDLGCGPGDICERLARYYPDAHITAVDAAEAMLEIARSRLGNLRGRIEYNKVYLPDRGLGNDYDLIVSNSLLHHMNNPADLWLTIRQSGQQGARVYVMDLVRPQSTARARQLVDTYAADEVEILKHDFYHSLLAAYTPEEVQQQLQLAGFAYLEVETVSDRHMLVSGELR